ncbi:MmgE/PrpD family protein [Sphingobium indicum BiD32]|uniref:MmgE/PrpD family protein n=1 Tax=Sphingobium indicum BiD32 TaxID=1301087 RepID=N1MS35_9SPHN|nr:MmgE/PrpD family protein [Sphingobium indicum]CCW20020.1 MmgE/PrpD family protein [Sphingobium indicum BiD32]
MSVTTTLSRFCATLSTDALPIDVVPRVRALVLDLMGCTIRANADAPAAATLKAGAIALGMQGGGAQVFGDHRKWSPVGATFLNAALGHALDFDDTHAPSTLHPGAPVIPAAFAAAAMAGASGADLIAGIVAGYETTCRIGLALPAGDHYARGFHPTATCGVFGAAAAAGRILRLDADQIESALGIALSQSAGSLQFLADGAWTKPFQVGWASQSGLSAALMAREGYRGPRAALEGRHGFLQGYAPSPQPERVCQDLGLVFETMATGIKPYPSCRYGHAGIDATLALRTQSGFDTSKIDRVTYGLSRAGLLLVGAPLEAKQNPTNLVGAQFSAPFVLSMALISGEMTWDSYKRLDDPAVRALMAKVDCVHDPDIEAEFPVNMAGKITIEADGERHTKTVIIPLGEPANFLSDDAIFTKFEGLARPVIGEQLHGIAEAVSQLDKLPNVQAWLEKSDGLRPQNEAPQRISS